MADNGLANDNNNAGPAKAQRADGTVPMNSAGARFSILNMAAKKENNYVRIARSVSEIFGDLLKFASTMTFVVVAILSVMEMLHPGSMHTFMYRVFNRY